nr:hypothetical protein CPGR_06084 [Mycolicibacter nonchromogenicus]
MLNVLFAWFQAINPPVNFCDTTSPSTVASPTGAPSFPAAASSLSHAAFTAPRTTKAPLSGLKKITGSSSAANELNLLPGIAPSAVPVIGKPRSLPAGPPSDSYLARTSPRTALAPVTGLK